MGGRKIVSFRPEPSEYAWTFGGADPVMKVSPGDILELWTDDCFTSLVRSVDDLVSEKLVFPFLNPQTGPFYVEGAEPGDTLALHFVSIEPSRDWGVSTTVPLFGALTSTAATVTLQDPLPEVVWLYEVDSQRRNVRYQARRGDYSVELPLEPMHGTVGVAPPNLEARSALVPGSWGGNMDTPEMRAGATCYLGVNVEGALFSIGDGHYRQGEGETCGVAVEGAMNTVLIVDLVKRRATPWPRLETDDYIISTGSARPLEDAFRIAHGDLVLWVVEEHGLDKLDAYQLVTQISESPAANVCDPNYTFVAKAPKRFLPHPHVYGSTRSRLSDTASEYLRERGTE
jgi:acetamidase/formamidase